MTITADAAVRRLRDYVDAWNALGCSCHECPTCDARDLSNADAEAIATLIESMADECSTARRHKSALWGAIDSLLPRRHGGGHQPPRKP